MKDLVCKLGSLAKLCVKIHAVNFGSPSAGLGVQNSPLLRPCEG